MAVSTPHGINVHKLDKPCLDGLSTWCTPPLLLMRNYSAAIVGRRPWVGRVRWLGCRTGGPTRAGVPALLTQFPGSIVSAKVMMWRTHSCVPRRHSCRRPFRQVVTATGVRQAEWRVFVKKSEQGGAGAFACQ